ncbi:MAG: orotate phosphoribosyltransferase [Deltaproteobacteria bacterium]|nr:orotate phosphoribosyltransferase [Deltaproteobacteria bacterium]
MAIDLNIEEGRIRLLELLKSLSFQRREIILASGRRSNFYIDCKQTALMPEGLYLIGNIFLYMIDEIGEKIDGVAGVTLGGDPLVCATSYASYVVGKNIPALIIRKELKGHGTEVYVEGKKNVPENAKVVILEDVVTTGGSTLKACDRVRQEGLNVAYIMCIVEREEGGKENIEAAGYRLYSIFRKRDFISE